MFLPWFLMHNHSFAFIFYIIICSLYTIKILSSIVFKSVLHRVTKNVPSLQIKIFFSFLCYLYAVHLKLNIILLISNYFYSIRPSFRQVFQYSITLLKIFLQLCDCHHSFFIHSILFFNMYLYIL